MVHLLRVEEEYRLELREIRFDCTKTFAIAITEF